MVAARSVGDDGFGVEKYQPLRNQTMGSCRGPVDKLRVPGAICQLEGCILVREKRSFCQLGCVNWKGRTVSTGVLQDNAGREHPARCTGRNRPWVHGRARASASIHEHPVHRSWVHGRARASTIIHEHPVRCTGRNRSWAHGRARASTSIHEHPVRCTGRNRSWVHGRARASTSTLCVAQVRISHGSM